ncbi:hypothetical protein ACFQVA_13215 [Actinomadura keratinilytica]
MFSEYVIGVGSALVLVGLIALLPWAVEVVVRRLRGGPVPWQLATRRSSWRAAPCRGRSAGSPWPWRGPSPSRCSSVRCTRTSSSSPARTRPAPRSASPPTTPTANWPGG